MKTFWKLSLEAIKKIMAGEIYETKKYRYVYRPDEDKVYRIEKRLLGTTEALNPENWIEQ